MLEDKYPNFFDFKRRIIAPAIKELNDTGQFKITAKENKEGKKVDNIDFFVEDLDKRIYFKEKDLKLIEEIVAPEEDKSLNNDDEKENTNESSSKEEIKETIDFYVPNKSFFTPKTLETLKEDFKDYDFKDKNNKLILLDAVGTTLDKFNEEKIKVNRYSYFRSTLSNKLKESKNKSEFKNTNSKIDNEIKSPTKFHNFEETYTKYSAEELEDMIERSQKAKYKK
jgi:plasmid replication initiation protein